MQKKSITLNLEILLRIAVFVLVFLGLTLFIFGPDFAMRREAQKTQERLVDAFIYVAKNWNEFNYNYRYGGNKNCSVPYTETEPCGIPVNLPQELSTFSKDALPAMGDPRYIMYWDSYDKVESAAWSGWFWVDAILWIIPESKLLQALKISGKVIFKLIPHAGIMVKGAQTLGKGVSALGKLVTFSGEKIVKGVKITLGEVKKEGSELTLKYLIAGDENAAYNTIKKGFKELAEKSSGNEKKIFEEAAKQIEEQEKVIKEQLEKEGKVVIGVGKEGKISTSFPTEKSELKGLEYLKKFENLPGDKADRMRELILQGKLRICAPAGVLGGLFYDELKKQGIITKDEEGNYYYKGEPIEQEFLWIGGLTFANGILKMRALKRAGNHVELTTVNLVDMSSDDMNKWVFYAYKYDENGNLVEIKLGTLKEIEQNRMFKIKSLGTCLVGAGITFALTDLVHTYEAKYETVKGEESKCKRAVCLKGQSMYPKSYKADELRKVFEQNKTCGIKLLNVDRRLERYTPNTPLGSADIANFYLASPCFAYAQIWVASCDDPEEVCDDAHLCKDWGPDEEGECEDGKNEDGTPCCKRCVWVSLMKAKGLKFQESSAYNYCAWSPVARGGSIAQTPPWPWAGYWDICPKFFGLEKVLGPISDSLCKLGEEMMMG